MEPEWGFEPGSAGYKATTMPFELSSIDFNFIVQVMKSIEQNIISNMVSLSFYKHEFAVSFIEA